MIVLVSGIVANFSLSLILVILLMALLLPLLLGRPCLPLDCARFGVSHTEASGRASGAEAVDVVFVVLASHGQLICS